jgi:hypothetical protein
MHRDREIKNKWLAEYDYGWDFGTGSTEETIQNVTYGGCTRNLFSDLIEVADDFFY